VKKRHQKVLNKGGQRSKRKLRGKGESSLGVKKKGPVKDLDSIYTPLDNTEGGLGDWGSSGETKQGEVSAASVKTLQ